MVRRGRRFESVRGLHKIPADQLLSLSLMKTFRSDRKGLPKPFQLAVIAAAHFDTVRLPFAPEPLQRAALALGAPIGRMLGYRPTTQRHDAGLRPHSRPRPLSSGVLELW
jgi:hypothetical protein